MLHSYKTHPIYYMNFLVIGMQPLLEETYLPGACPYLPGIFQVRVCVARTWVGKGPRGVHHTAGS